MAELDTTENTCPVCDAAIDNAVNVAVDAALDAAINLFMDAAMAEWDAISDEIIEDTMTAACRALEGADCPDEADIIGCAAMDAAMEKWDSLKSKFLLSAAARLKQAAKEVKKI